MKIIDDYFQNATFFKPTGDGLLITVPYDEENLSIRVNETVEDCLRLTTDFGGILMADGMVNFKTPEKIGIGLARGSACCITSKETILDYSGKILNLASRLMDIARPSGIVIDSRFGLDLLSKQTQNLFSKDEVYVRGIAETEPIVIHYTKEHTYISESYRLPISEPIWDNLSTNASFKELKMVGGKYFGVTLNGKPTDIEKIVAVIEWTPKGAKYPSRIFSKIGDGMLNYQEKGNRHLVGFAKTKLIEFLTANRVVDDDDVTLSVSYPFRR